VGTTIPERLAIRGPRTRGRNLALLLDLSLIGQRGREPISYGETGHRKKAVVGEKKMRQFGSFNGRAEGERGDIPLSENGDRLRGNYKQRKRVYISAGRLHPHRGSLQGRGQDVPRQQDCQGKSLGNRVRCLLVGGL